MIFSKLKSLSKDLSSKGEQYETVEEIFMDKTTLQRRQWYFFIKQ